MFKKYRFEWNDGGKTYSTDFFVNSKSARSGFIHRACAIGPVPRLDDMGSSWSEYKANDDTLFKKRVAKVSYCNRTWESYSGQTCLSKLWEQLNDLKFVDMRAISEINPFVGGAEPGHEDIPDPDELFSRFSRR